ncbi:hypothetical protein BDF19DRAFT_455511 [Syncephalis fuscata]|nr:hypothetical protein BDF19DRAFT_455511 [Syncephalis fuscata]
MEDSPSIKNTYGDTTSFFPPAGYVTAPFPSLYWPTKGAASHDLLYKSEVWHFTLIWTLIFVCSIYFLAGLWAMLSLRGRPYFWAPPLLFGLLGALGAIIGGTVAGIVLGAIYDAGYFRMSPWVPFMWGLAQALITIISSYSTISTIL